MRSNKRRRMPRLSPLSTATISCPRTGSNVWCRILIMRMSALYNRRRITATATKALSSPFVIGEYAGFFNIGMVQRNEYNAIIQHGTMTMIRKSALLEVGNWAEWCICEDSELGLRLYEAGYDSVYVKDSFWPRLDARHDVGLYDAAFPLGLRRDANH